MKDFFLKTIYARLGIATALSMVAIWFLPRIDNDIFRGNSAPGSLTILGVGIVVTVLTAFALHTGINSEVSVPKKFVLFALLYNVLYIMARFALEPLAVYQANVTKAFDFPINEPMILVVFAGMSFLLYIAIFAGLFYFFKRRAEKAAGIASTPIKGKVVLFAGLALVAGLIVLASTTTIFVMPFLYALLATEYVYLMLTTLYGVLTSLALIGALFFLGSALKSAADQSAALRDMSVLVSFFWVGAAFLLAYHALWIVYLITITTIWPLRVVIPK